MYSAHGTAFPKFYMTPEILKEDNFIPDTLALLPLVFITIGSIILSKEAWNTAINSTASAEQQCLDCSTLLAQYSVGGMRIVVYILLVYLFQD